jgi:hypothetical protein
MTNLAGENLPHDTLKSYRFWLSSTELGGIVVQIDLLVVMLT